jgi:hypothetical protein
MYAPFFFFFFFFLFPFPSFFVHIVAMVFVIYDSSN